MEIYLECGEQDFINLHDRAEFLHRVRWDSDTGTSITRCGVEHLGSHSTYLDLTPFGRQETWGNSPSGWPQTEAYGGTLRHDDYNT